MIGLSSCAHSLPATRPQNPRRRDSPGASESSGLASRLPQSRTNARRSAECRLRDSSSPGVSPRACLARAAAAWPILLRRSGSRAGWPQGAGGTAKREVSLAGRTCVKARDGMDASRHKAKPRTAAVSAISDERGIELDAVAVTVTATIEASGSLRTKRCPRMREHTPARRSGWRLGLAWLAQRTEGYCEGFYCGGSESRTRPSSLANGLAKNVWIEPVRQTRRASSRARRVRNPVRLLSHP